MSERRKEDGARFPVNEVEMRGYVTHEYHLHMIQALVAERKELEAKLAKPEGSEGAAE